MSTRYSFRIKPGTGVAQVLDEVIQNGITSQEDLRSKNHNSNDIWLAWALARFSDNFSISRSGGASYTDVVPNTVVQSQVVKASVLSSDGAGTNDNQPIESIRFPNVPVIKDPMGNFRRPSWYEPMRIAVKAGKHISLSGPPGIGKSTAVEQLAAEERKPLVHIGADAGLRRRDLTGNTELINGHTSFMVAEYVAAAVNGWWAIVDEANAAEPDAIMMLNGQIAPPYMVNFYGKSAPVHPDFRLFITYNHGLVGTKPLPDSFKDRFFPIKLSFPTDTQLRSLLVANGMPEDGSTSNGHSWVTVAQAVVKFARQSWEAHEKGLMRYQITPRRLMDAIFLIKTWDNSSTDKVAEALDLAVISAVDNQAEVTQLQRILFTIKTELMNGRL